MEELDFIQTGIIACVRDDIHTMQMPQDVLFRAKNLWIINQIKIYYAFLQMHA